MYHVMCHVTCQVTDHVMKHVTVHVTLSAHDWKPKNNKAAMTRTWNSSHSSLYLPLETQGIAPTNRRASLEPTYWLTETDPLQRRTEPAQSSQLNEEEHLGGRTLS